MADTGQGQAAELVVPRDLAGLHVCSALVALQSVTGFVVWAINSAFMAFYAFAVLIYYAMGLRGLVCECMLPFVGKSDNVLGIDKILSTSYLLSSGIGQSFPLATMIYFHFVLAAITLAIIAPLAE